MKVSLLDGSIVTAERGGDSMRRRSVATFPAMIFLHHPGRLTAPNDECPVGTARFASGANGDANVAPFVMPGSERTT